MDVTGVRMLALLALLPIASMLLLVMGFTRRGICLRSSFLAAAIAWGVILTAFTEVLSLFNLLNVTWLSILWGATAIALACAVFRGPNPQPVKPDYNLPAFLIFLGGAVGSIVILTGITALVAPPNNWDSMTYHMSRVMHWMQNRSVAHYPTHILRQIELNPWAEFAIANFQILSGGDRLANLVQWFSMVGCITGVTLIAGKLGADRKGEVFAAVVAATIPMGILQASSSQNDYVVSFWLVCFVYFGFLFKEKPGWSSALALGGSLGLAVLTKATAYLYAFPFLVWFTLSSLKSSKSRAVTYGALILIVVMALNAGHYARNYATFGNILSSGDTRYSNEAHTVGSLISNASRNIALHMVTPFDAVNDLTMSGFRWLHTTLSLDINDPRTTWPGQRFAFNKPSIHEDRTGNLLHALLICASLVLVLSRKKIRQKPDMLPYVLSLMIAFALFCFYLKWQEWGNRLHLPLFVLWSPIIASAFAEIGHVWIAKIVMAILVICSLPYLLCNESRPLMSHSEKPSIFGAARIDQYFINNPGLERDYYGIAQHLKSIGCNNIALQAGIDTWEYPLWMLIQQESHQMPRIEHINVTNKSGNIPIKDFYYCIVVSID